MKAVVLVGGEGTRLRPLTATLPKQMLPIVEVPMIERVATHLAEHGMHELVLSLGYRPDVFLNAFPKNRVGHVPVRYIIEPEPRGTAGAIRFAALAAEVDDTFVAVNGDVLTDLDVSALVDFHRRRGAEATVALTRVEDTSAFGVVDADEDGKVSAFREKPQRSPGAVPGAGEINAGTYVLEMSVLDRIPDEGMVSIELEVFPGLAEEGSLYALPSDAYWLDTGTPAQYLQAQYDLLDGLRPGPPAPKAHRRDGDVWVLGEAIIDGYVAGPSLVGNAAYVQHGARVERSVIGAGARVHDRAVVRNSVLLPGATVRAGAEVDESIVGEGAVVGEDARVSGLSVIGKEIEVGRGERLHGAKVPKADR